MLSTKQIHEVVKQGCMEAYKEERSKDVYIRAQKEVNEQFGRKINQDVSGNRRLFWKEVS